MWLPSQAQVNAFTRNVASGIGGAVLMFGLSTKVDIATVNSIISATGTVVNDIVVLIGVASPFIAGYFASKSASPTGQAAAIGASDSTTVKPAPGGGATVTITDPAMASAALAAQNK